VWGILVILPQTFFPVNVGKWNETPFCGSQAWYFLQGIFAYFFIPKDLHPYWGIWILGTLMTQNLCT